MPVCVLSEIRKSIVCKIQDMCYYLHIVDQLVTGNINYYLCPHYVYVAQNFSVGPMYSRNGPLGDYLIPVSKP